MPQENIFGKLVEKRGVERAAEAEAQHQKQRAKQLEERIQVEENPHTKELLQRLLERQQKAFEARQQELQMSAEQISEGLQEEGVSETMMKNLTRESRLRLFSSVRLYHRLKDDIKFLEKELGEHMRQGDTTSLVYSDVVRQVQVEIADSKDALRHLEDSRPEAFLAVNLFKLREYAQQRKRGKLVETPWVQERKAEIKSLLATGRSVFLYGETGTGKTEMAKLVANEVSGGYEVVRGHRFMVREELLGYLGLSATEAPDPATVPGLVKRAAETFDRENPEIDPMERDAAHKIIHDTVVGQSSDPATITKYFLGPVYRAVREKKVLIIDEANYIPPGLVASLNEILASWRVGGTIKVSETGEEIPIEGGGVILTGNITLGQLAKYRERFELDPALRDRVKLLEYNTPPQMVEGKIGEPGDRDLYLIALSMLIDEKGNLSAPPEALDEVWRLCQGFKLFQDIFAGKQIGSAYQFVQQGQPLAVQVTKNNLSMRKLENIIEGWQRDGYSRELDWYLWKEVVEQAMDTPQEAAYFYQIFQEKYDFFRGQGWNQKPEYGSGGTIVFVPKIDFNAQFAEERPVAYTPQELVEAATGKKMPEFSVDVETEEQKLQRERAERAMHMEREIEALQVEWQKEWDKFEKFCPPLPEELETAGSASS